MATSVTTARRRWAGSSCFYALPPWLTSAIVHLAVILLLGLLHVTRAGSSPFNMTIDLVDAGGGSSGQLDAADFESTLPAASELPANISSAKIADFVPLEMPSAIASVELPDLVNLDRLESSLPGSGGAGKGAGQGTGIGEGEGPGKGDGKGRTSVFGLAAEGRTFVYVFDRSESMGYVYYSQEETTRFGIPLQAAKDELLASLHDLGLQQQFQIVFYNHRPELFRTAGRRAGLPAFATRDNKARAMDFVYNIRPVGGTNHMSALDVAVRMKPDVIFLLTDGLAEDDPTLLDLEQISNLNRGTTSINVIQFAEAPRPDSSLIQLAAENRGQYAFVNITQAGDQARKIGKQLRHAIEAQLKKGL